MQLFGRQRCRTVGRSEIVKIPIATAQSRKLIGSNIGKRSAQQTVAVCGLQQATHPKINVIGMRVHATQSFRIGRAKLFEGLHAWMAGGLQIVIVRPDAVITAALHIDGGQIEAERFVAAKQKAAQLA